MTVRLCVAFALLLLAGPGAHAAILVSESFNYGATSGGLAGSNGGTGC